MSELKLKMSGTFVYEDGGKQLGTLKFITDGKILTALSTDVLQEARGKGIAGKLFEMMIEFVKKNDLKLASECSYVDAKLLRKPEEYRTLIAI